MWSPVACLYKQTSGWCGALWLAYISRQVAVWSSLGCEASHAWLDIIPGRQRAKCNENFKNFSHASELSYIFLPSPLYSPSGTCLHSKFFSLSPYFPPKIMHIEENTWISPNTNSMYFRSVTTVSCRILLPRTGNTTDPPFFYGTQCRAIRVWRSILNQQCYDADQGTF